MVTDAVDGADDVVDKNGGLQGPVGRTFESAIGVAGDPEVLPDEQAITVGQFIEIIGLAEAAAPDADHVDIGIAAETQLIVVALTVPVEHHIGNPGAADEVDAFAIDIEIAANQSVDVWRDGADGTDAEHKGGIVGDAVRIA